jgi:hypothetical protein
MPQPIPPAAAADTIPSQSGGLIGSSRDVSDVSVIEIRDEQYSTFAV